MVQLRRTAPRKPVAVELNQICVGSAGLDAALLGGLGWAAEAASVPPRVPSHHMSKAERPMPQDWVLRGALNGRRCAASSARTSSGASSPQANSVHDMAKQAPVKVSCGRRSGASGALFRTQCRTQCRKRPGFIITRFETFGSVNRRRDECCAAARFERTNAARSAHLSGTHLNDAGSSSGAIVPGCDASADAS